VLTVPHRSSTTTTIHSFNHQTLLPTLINDRNDITQIQPNATNVFSHSLRRSQQPSLSHRQPLDLILLRHTPSNAQLNSQCLSQAFPLAPAHRQPVHSLLFRANERERERERERKNGFHPTMQHTPTTCLFAYFTMSTVHASYSDIHTTLPRFTVCDRNRTFQHHQSACTHSRVLSTNARQLSNYPPAPLLSGVDGLDFFGRHYQRSTHSFIHTCMQARPSSPNIPFE